MRDLTRETDNRSLNSPDVNRSFEIKKLDGIVAISDCFLSTFIVSYIQIVRKKSNDRRNQDTTRCQTKHSRFAKTAFYRMIDNLRKRIAGA